MNGIKKILTFPNDFFDELIFGTLFAQIYTRELCEELEVMRNGVLCQFL